MVVQKRAAASLIAIGALAAAAPSQAVSPDAAATVAPAAQRSCFFLSDWQGWSSPRPDVIYIRVRRQDVYRVDLGGGGSTFLTQQPFYHLVNKVHGDDSVCDAIDLDLSVSDGSGMMEPLFPTAITRLTPAQIAAIPKKDLP